jgi:hypothetical protein
VNSTHQLTSGIENIRLRRDGEDPRVFTLFVITAVDMTTRCNHKNSVTETWVLSLLCVGRRYVCVVSLLRLILITLHPFTYSPQRPVYQCLDRFSAPPAVQTVQRLPPRLPCWRVQRLQPHEQPLQVPPACWECVCSASMVAIVLAYIASEAAMGAGSAGCMMAEGARLQRTPSASSALRHKNRHRRTL